jgi:hypothetical protein
MRIIKLYEEFWGKSKSNNEDLEFDFLVAVGKMKQAINKTIEVHEKHYYNDDKIVKSEELQSELKSMIDSIIATIIITIPNIVLRIILPILTPLSVSIQV